MLRSLFIGFLILSTLASKGVGVPINQNNINISADMLLEFFNAVVAHTDKQAELSVAKTDRVFLSNTSGSGGAIEELLRPIRPYNQVVWAEPDDKSNCSNPPCGDADLQQKQFCKGEVYSCCTDLSPPHYSVNYPK